MASGSVMAGLATATTNFTTTSTTAVLVAGMSLTFTVPSGGRSVKLTVFTRNLTNNTAGAYGQIGIWDGAVGGTRVGGPPIGLAWLDTTWLVFVSQW